MSDAAPVERGRQPTELLPERAAASGDANVISGPDIRASFETVWTSPCGANRVVVVRPLPGTEVVDADPSYVRVQRFGSQSPGECQERGPARHHGWA